MIDAVRFSEARAAALADTSINSQIGTLGEKMIHKVLKYYFEPNVSFHEVEYLDYVADIMNGDGIVEIQTRAFERLAPKLAVFLDECKVTVVYPIIIEKTLTWIEPESGEITASRKVSKKGKASDVLPELSKIAQFLSNENLTLALAFISADEFRYLDGYGVEKKKRATKINKIPQELNELRYFSGVKDMKKLLPENLPDIFTAKDFNRVTALRGRKASFALGFCMKLGFIKRIGKEKNAFIYEKT